MAFEADPGDQLGLGRRRRRGRRRAGCHPIAYFAATSDSPLATLFERATYVGFAVPGIVLALALVYFGSGYLPWIYQTLPLLVFAYVVRFLPQVVGSTRTAILGVDPKLVEAGRTLGESSMGAFRRVTFPLTRSGIVAGAALVFLTTMKELPVTLILRPSGFETIVTQIWRAQETALYQYAVVPTLILLVISGLSMVVILTQEGGEEGCEGAVAGVHNCPLTDETRSAPTSLRFHTY